MKAVRYTPQLINDVSVPESRIVRCFTQVSERVVLLCELQQGSVVDISLVCRKKHTSDAADGRGRVLFQVHYFGD